MTQVIKRKTELASPFITAYLVGGYPSKEKNIELLKEAEKSGLNAIEIGFPSKAPYMDGETIKQAHKETENIFSDLDDFIDYLKDVRAAISIPIWIMGYVDDLFRDQAYIRLAESSYIDGFIIPDINVDQMNQAQQYLATTGAKFIPVVNNNMSDEEITILAENKEVIYCQLYAGKTGHKLTDTSTFPLFYERMRKLTNAKLMAGFGINSQEIAGKIFEVGYDGIVVGSEFVRIVATEKEETLYKFIRELVNAKKKWG
ncbi:tryptophan synthase subunit alpha [Pseudogracilibacillus sp. SE30717A]|uniref:tryptophan synthase subunit alpha n=1 Tax=Pseudogracilibacillus sp. SE30717A TaxID=3098293 RepID=UPI00300E0843